MDKNSQKTTDIRIFVRETNTKKVLNYLFKVGRPVKVNEIIEDTGLTYEQLYRTIQFLNSMNKITKKYEMGPAKKGHPPRRIVWISLEGSQIDNARRVLLKHKRMKILFGRLKL